MTRFARAEGSKGSNKRKVEDATPWLEMKAQSMAVKKQKKKEESASSKKVDVIHSKVETVTIDKEIKVNKKKLKEKKLKSEANNPEGKENLLNIDAAPVSSLEKNKVLTVKKSKVRLKKLRKLERDGLLIPKDGDGKTNEKDKRNKIEKGMDYVIEDGKKFKVLKNGRKKPWFDLPYQENEVMTRYKNFYIKRNMVQVLDDLRRSLEDDGVEAKKIYTTMLHEERKAHTKLRVELLRDQIKTVKEETGKFEKQKVKKEKKLKKKDEEKQLKEEKKKELKEKPKKELKGKKKSDEVVESEGTVGDGFQDFGAETGEKKRKEYKLEDSELMTKFEDYWVLRNKVKKLKFVREAKIKRLIEARTEPNESALLTPEEELIFRRLMKKEKRREHSILLKRIDRLGYEVMEDMELGDDDGNEDKVKFMGFYVKKSAAGRLEELKDNLEKGGASQEEVFEAMKAERRKEERYLKNENKVYCYNCRKSGHMVSDCPNENTIGHCFTCGSTEHMARNCPEKTFGGPRFSHATCFVCGKIGHIASGCSDNPKGIYPNGGCCNECGSVRHLKASCPDLQMNNKQEVIDLHARVISSSAGIEDLGEDSSVATNSMGRNSKRIVFTD